MSRIRQRPMPEEQRKRDAHFYSLCVQSDRYLDESYHDARNPIRFDVVKDYEARLSAFERFARDAHPYVVGAALTIVIALALLALWGLTY